jgi:hypothetical protein
MNVLGAMVLGGLIGGEPIESDGYGTLLSGIFGGNGGGEGRCWESWLTLGGVFPDC